MREKKKRLEEEEKELKIRKDILKKQHKLLEWEAEKECHMRIKDKETKLLARISDPEGEVQRMRKIFSK